MALGIALADRCDAPAWLAALPVAAGLALACARRFRAAAAVALACAAGLHAQAARLADARAASAGDAREVVVEGVAIGQRAARLPARSPELSRMLEDFASELQKLDEGLRLLTAFLSRLREQTLEPARTFH